VFTVSYPFPGHLFKVRDPVLRVLDLPVKVTVQAKFFPVFGTMEIVFPRIVFDKKFLAIITSEIVFFRVAHFVMMLTEINLTFRMRSKYVIVVQGNGSPVSTEFTPTTLQGPLFLGLKIPFGLFV
jgi:hypothetical protein